MPTVEGSQEVRGVQGPSPSPTNSSASWGPQTTTVRVRCARCSGVRRWESVGRCEELQAPPKAITPFDRSVIRSAGSRQGPRRRRFGLNPPHLMCLPDHVLGSTRGRVDHEGVTKVSSTNSLTSFRYYHRTVGNEKQFETESVVCGGRGRKETDVSEVIEEKTKEGWRLHSSEKLANGRTRLTFRRPLVR